MNFGITIGGRFDNHEDMTWRLTSFVESKFWGDVQCLSFCETAQTRCFTDLSNYLMSREERLHI